MTFTAWDTDCLQFPRLLSEVNTVLTDDQIKEIADSMDVTPDRVCELFSRAEKSFKAIKRDIGPGSPRVPLTMGEIDKLTAHGTERLRVCLWVELGLIVGANGSRRIDSINELFDELVYDTDVPGVGCDISYRVVGARSRCDNYIISGEVLIEYQADVSELFEDLEDVEGL